MSAPARIVYYLDVMSSWCHWAEPAWADLQRRYAGRVDFEWRIALMNPGDFPASRAQCDWFFRRSGVMVRSPFMLNSGWVEPGRQGDYRAANLVAEAARELGAVGDEVRLSLAQAALREGRTIGDMAAAVSVVDQAFTSMDPGKLLELAGSREIQARVAASTAEFFARGLTQRPAFILTDAIGDQAVFSGLASVAPLAAALDAMLADCAAYAAHAAHFGAPPTE